MPKIIDTLLLLALPASGKSEVRRYLTSVPPDRMREDFHLGPNVQLDDFPYVHLMRRIDDELERRERPRVFFHSDHQPFLDTRDWGTLIELVNDDYAALTAPPPTSPADPAAHLFRRIDAASARTGLPPRLAPLPAAVRDEVATGVRDEAEGIVRDLRGGRPDRLDGHTVVIEFARGGPDGSDFPLPHGYGYGYSLGRLSPAILEKAAVLYVWVTPEESRRKNDARTDPNDPGSILHHGVPIEVMLGDYGCDDMQWMLDRSGRPGTLAVEAHGRVHHLPVARFDNRVDRTSFIRNDEAAWKPEEVAALHDGLRSALAHLAGE